MEGIAPVVHTSLIRVRYADTDQMRNVYYGRYFEYFEQSRSDLLRELGLPYSELEADGYLLPVLEARAVYHRPARYDDLIAVEATAEPTPGVRLRITYKVTNHQTGELIAEGHTVHVFLNAESRRPTRAPERFLEVMRRDGKS